MHCFGAQYEVLLSCTSESLICKPIYQYRLLKDLNNMKINCVLLSY